MTAKKKKPSRPGRDVPVKVQLDRWKTLSTPSPLLGADGLSLERLEQIESKVKSGDSTEGELRLEVCQLIAWVLSQEDDKRGRGAPKNLQLGLSARIVWALHEKHNVPIAAAARALVDKPESTEGFSRAKSIERAYRRLRKAGGGPYLVSEQLVQQALARIPAKKEVPNSGN
jgi:hypothetical protein